MLLAEQFETLLAQALHLDEFGPASDDEDDDSNSPDNAPENDLEDSDLEEEDYSQDSTQSKYYPYPSKLVMLMDILDNLPRLRLSSHSVKLFLWMLKELGVPEVPSFNKFRALQESLRKKCGYTPKAHISDFKNHYHSISLQDSIAKDFANPQIAPHINLYPERTDGARSETWQFDRWTEFPPEQLTPMFSRGMKQFWIEEVAQLSDGSFVIPHNWIYVNTAGARDLCSDCSIIQQTATGWVITNEQRTISSSMFIHNYEDVISKLNFSVIPWNPDTNPVPEMPNSLRKIAEGDDLYVVMVPLWCDDVSGNKSKQYNKHINIYSVNGSLPGQILQQEYFVNFVSTSPNATPLEQFASLRDEIRETEKNPVRCYNAATGRMCRTIIRVPILPADNPAQSEEASHMGSKANHPCRKCNVGGSYKETETPEGYHCFFFLQVSVRRSADEIKTELNDQLRAAMTGVEANVTKSQTESGTKDKITQTWIEKLIAQARTFKEETSLTEVEITAKLQEWFENQPGNKMNPLLDITGLDPSQDTPVEILHTVLLGIVKYVWAMTHTAMSEKELELLAIRLQSTDLDGLTVPPLRAAYMIQYRNNLIGKHFKTLMQILPFHIHNFTKLDSAHFTLIRSVGALAALLWVPEINNMDQYLDDIETLVGNVLDAFADVAPSKILAKIKIHLLTHLRDDIRRFGPLIRYSTEIFECFNAVFRLCSIYSNHQAPSRDIAFKFASMGRMKHILSGGFWQHENLHGEQTWVQASDAVRGILRDVPIIQRHLGWVPQSDFQRGQISFKSRAKANEIPWQESQAAIATKNSSLPPQNIAWFTGSSPKVIAQTGDICTIGSWVFAKTEEVKFEDSLPLIGRIAEILLRGDSKISQGVITLEQFQLGANLHEDFQCPVLRRCMPQKLVAVRSSAVQFRFSVQHDCRLAKCQPTHRVHQIQERQITERTQLLLKHTDDDNFVINMYALHNAMVLRETLPCTLWQPSPLYEDRQARHHEIAVTLATEQGEKRAQTREKTRATKEHNKAAAQRNAPALVQQPVAQARRKRKQPSENEIKESEDVEPGGSVQKKSKNTNV
ncbi:hypothetical protein C8R42DRAFT_755961 [Lentinula raphanica]|nr:hypothetical protein C8R42DRAFT_755961 [Lentinula raphanica]